MVTGIIESHIESATSHGLIAASTQSVALFAALGEAVLKCSSSDAPWKILGFAAPKINSLLLTESGQQMTSGLLRTYAVLYLQTSLLLPWRTITPTPSIVLEEECLHEHSKSEHDALAAFLLDLLNHFDTLLQHAVHTGADSASLVMPALRLRLALPSSVLSERRYTTELSKNAVETSVLQLILAENLRREVGDIGRLRRTLGFLEGLLRERDDRIAVTEEEKDHIISFIKAVKCSHSDDADILSYCSEVLGHSD